MPLSSYFGGSGEKVMDSMKKTYGAGKARQVFYATANKKGLAELSRAGGKKHGGKKSV